MRATLALVLGRANIRPGARYFMITNSSDITNYDERQGHVILRNNTALKPRGPPKARDHGTFSSKLTHRV